MLSNTRHLRLRPDTLPDGTSPIGIYGNKLSEKLLIWDFFIYLALLMLTVYGCCNRRASYKNAEPDSVENEEADIKAERERLGVQLDGISTPGAGDTLQVYNLVK